MSTNFADAPAGDAAKGAKIFKTKYVLVVPEVDFWLMMMVLYYYWIVDAHSAMLLKREEVISRDQTWEASLEDRLVRLRDTRTVRQTRTRVLSGMRTPCMNTCWILKSIFQEPRWCLLVSRRSKTVPISLHSWSSQLHRLQVFFLSVKRVGQARTVYAGPYFTRIWIKMDVRGRHAGPRFALQPPR